MIKKLYTESTRIGSDRKKVVSRSTNQLKSNKNNTKISINNENRRQKKTKGEKIGIKAEK